MIQIFRTLILLLSISVFSKHYVLFSPNEARPNNILLYLPVSPHVNNAKNVLHKLFSITVGRTFVSGQSRNAGIFFCMCASLMERGKVFLRVFCLRRKHYVV